MTAKEEFEAAAAAAGVTDIDAFIATVRERWQGKPLHPGVFAHLFQTPKLGYSPDNEPGDGYWAFLQRELAA